MREREIDEEKTDDDELLMTQIELRETVMNNATNKSYPEHYHRN